MNAEVATPLIARMNQAFLVRVVEEELLRLFAEGRLSGTTHTCIGQEMSAIALTESLDRSRDVIVSNHRCHGHYLAWTDDVDGLIAEVMGKRTGVCAGMGGSQHLHGTRFFSNGVQGGGMPIAAGLAFAQKRNRTDGIVAACIGDGTLGEGTVYETFNVASKWGLPLLVVLENNLYAQSTAQVETLAGDIDARARAFGIATFSGDTWRSEELLVAFRCAVDRVRDSSMPAFVRVDTYRLAAHSKGDDDRNPAEIASYAERDPVNRFVAEQLRRGQETLEPIRRRVQRAVAVASTEEPGSWHEPSYGRSDNAGLKNVELKPETQLEAIRSALAAWMAEDPRVILLGEDIRSPYGGAFKVTKGLSDSFPDRVLNTPISEAAIVGIGSGLAIGEYRPVVEIMFGDFLTLCMDQLVNHAAKFPAMYAGKVSTPLIVRTPMGGGRGYGPTHSQNIEKHFVGVPGLTVLILHGRTDIEGLYRTLRGISSPVLLIENKLLYRERGDAALPRGYEWAATLEPFPTTVLSPPGDPDLTIVAFGRMSVLAEAAARRLASEEIQVELMFPLQASPWDARALRAAVARTGKALIVEEGSSGYDLAAEVIASLAATRQVRTAPLLRRIGAAPSVIPSAPTLEKHVLPSEDAIVEACLELFDA